ncbi:hypothetical protein [Duganella sp. SG902]|uniref:hypothetical protein n=1 Tax=Duganella sp. SG902 TaxID=2587016 RepID=UPI001C40647D|nr:hypothetical protein [Duganella sp. SG902]
MNILAYVESYPFDVANEGLFYCFRAFNELDWPREMRRDFFFDAPSSVPGPESRAITLAILAGIEEQEGKPLDEIDKETLNKYAVEIGDAGDILTDRLLLAHRTRLMFSRSAAWPR